ncbi:MAG: YicC family protein [Gammaproteobacteria bacterium]|nr:YicC family protein [Gammaproteobacteria bacterium]MDH5653186.1 YicC family protein [Gammaproteobacteria bacterium]
MVVWVMIQVSRGQYAATGTFLLCSIQYRRTDSLINSKEDTAMIRSMTAFSRKETTGDWGELTLELRTVNHRYLDVSIRMPEELRSLEPGLRELIGTKLARGKVECNIRFNKAEQTQNAFTVNKELAGHLAKASREVDALLYNPSPINSLDVLRWPGVLQYQQQDMTPVHQALETTLVTALDDLIANREREGEKLQQLIEQRSDAIRAEVENIRAVLPEIMQKWTDKLKQRLDELKAGVDEARLAQETAMMAQKMDVEEELDRILTHLDEIKGVLAMDEPVGRRLDFLMQELHREANTLGSKSVDKASTKTSVELKVLIEQAREQVQNIE